MALTSDLYYLRARFYDWTNGRFLQTDPIGYDGGPNGYVYAGGDPVNAADPSGLKAKKPTYKTYAPWNGLDVGANGAGSASSPVDLPGATVTAIIIPNAALSFAFAAGPERNSLSPDRGGKDAKEKDERDRCTLAPDRTPMGADFSTACKNHDSCYATLGASKSECDRRFLDEMIEACRGTKPQWLCDQLAFRYYRVVRGLPGRIAFAYEQFMARRRQR